MELIANMKKISRNESEASVREALGLVNLEDRVESRISSLSGGMVRRLGIAQALMGDPGIIVLDEPTAGLDPEERLRFKNTVNKIKKNKIIIISTHIVDDVEAVCDRIVIVNNGKFVKSGSCEEIRNIADGKTYVLESDRQKEIQSDYELAGQFEADGVNMVKVLSKTPLPYRKTAPQLEDGYLCALKGI